MAMYPIERDANAKMEAGWGSGRDTRLAIYAYKCVQVRLVLWFYLISGHT